jgi:hypothetical protein
MLTIKQQSDLICERNEWRDRARANRNWCIAFVVLSAVTLVLAAVGA